MYHPFKVSKLSKMQLSKLMKGMPVRIKKGDAQMLHLSMPQIKKLESAFKKGRAHTLQFDPFQMSGKGMFSSGVNAANDLYHDEKKKGKDKLKGKGGFVNWIKDTGKEVGDAAAERLEGAIAGSDPQYNQNQDESLEGSGMKKRRGRPKKMKGKGGFVSWIKDTGKEVGDAAAERLEGAIAGSDPQYNQNQDESLEGSGMKKRRGRPKKSKGGALYAAGPPSGTTTTATTTTMSGGKVNRLHKFERIYDSVAKRVKPLVKPIVKRVAPAIGDALAYKIKGPQLALQEQAFGSLNRYIDNMGKDKTKSTIYQLGNGYLESAGDIFDQEGNMVLDLPDIPRAQPIDQYKNDTLYYGFGLAKKRGRPRKQKHPGPAPAVMPKRKRGRPKKMTGAALYAA